MLHKCYGGKQSTFSTFNIHGWILWKFGVFEGALGAPKLRFRRGEMWFRKSWTIVHYVENGISSLRNNNFRDFDRIQKVAETNQNLKTWCFVDTKRHFSHTEQKHKKRHFLDIAFYKKRTLWKMWCFFEKCKKPLETLTFLPTRDFLQDA